MDAVETFAHSRHVIEISAHRGSRSALTNRDQAGDHHSIATGKKPEAATGGILRVVRSLRSLSRDKRAGFPHRIDASKAIHARTHTQPGSANLLRPKQISLLEAQEWRLVNDTVVPRTRPPAQLLTRLIRLYSQSAIYGAAPYTPSPRKKLSSV